MKKLLFALFLFCSFYAQAQFSKPSGATPITGYTLFYNPADSTFTICWSNPQTCNTFVQDFDTVKLSGWVNNRKLLKYRLIGDSILKDGTASNYKLLHKIDSIMALVKYRNDTVIVTGYATRGYVQRNFVAKNDSSKLYERIANKSTTTTLGTSNILYPTQNAVKTYIDTHAGLTTTAHGLGASAFHADSYWIQNQITSAQTGASWITGTTRGNIYQIFTDGAFRGGLYHYAAALGSGSDYSVGIVSESDIFMARGGSPTKVFNITATGIGAGTNSPLGSFAIKKATATSGVTAASYYLNLGMDNVYTPGNTSLIGFGYSSLASATYSPAYMGYVVTSDEGYTHGDLIFATRNGTGDTAPVEAMRINSLQNFGFGYDDPGSYKMKVNGTGFFATSLTTPTINLSTDAVVNYFWKCTNSTTGAGAWAAISESQFYNGAWDADANLPALADGGGAAQGTYYHCVVSGTVDFDGAGGRAAIAFTQYMDDVAYNGTIWEKVPNAQYALLVMSPSVLGGSKLGSGMEVGNEAADMLNIKNEDKGNISVTGSGSSSGRIWTIDSGVVSLAMMANMNTAKVIGRMTASAGVPEELAVSGTVSVAMTTGATLTDATLVNPALGTPASGVATNLTGTAGSLNIGGNAATATNLTGLTTLVATLNTLPILTVQSLSGTTPAWNVVSGINATLTLSGNTTITLSNLVAGTSGNITITNPATAYTITFSGYTNKISPGIYTSANVVTASGGSKIDVLSWWYDGTYLLWNGTKNYQ